MRPAHASRLAAAASVLVLATACHRAETGKAQPEAPRPDTSGQLAVNVVTPKQTAPMVITSDSFPANGAIPDRFSAYGENVSPQLAWTPVDNAKAYAIVVEDPDAPKAKPFVHWVAWTLAPETHALPSDLSKAAGSVQTIAQGKNGSDTAAWFGPHPPKGDPAHHYHFEVFALDGPLSLTPGSDRDALVGAVKGHVLAQGELVGTYQPPAKNPAP